MTAIKAKLADYTVTGSDTTIVKNDSLESAVKSNKGDAVTALQTVDPGVKADQVTVDASGNVVIKSKSFADAIKGKKDGVAPAMGTNTGCGAGC
jgi:hypothetical protein